VKHEDIYLREHASVPALEAGLEAWFERDNAWRPHEALATARPKRLTQPLKRRRPSRQKGKSQHEAFEPGGTPRQ
jgi:hypothetical protein